MINGVCWRSSLLVTANHDVTSFTRHGCLSRYLIFEREKTRACSEKLRKDAAQIRTDTCANSILDTKAISRTPARVDAIITSEEPKPLCTLAQCWRPARSQSFLPHALNYDYDKKYKLCSNAQQMTCHTLQKMGAGVPEQCGSRLKPSRISKAGLG